MKNFGLFSSMLACVLLLGIGCQGNKSDAGYSTIRGDPRRDTERARSENARGISLIEQEKWSEAESSLKEALDADVTFGPAHNNLGRVYFQERKLYQAAWEFQYAAKLMPFSPEPKSNLGLVLEETGKLDEAVKHYDEALTIEPANPQFIGNAVRARIRRGDRDSHTRALLQELVSVDNRPEWIEWARQQLVLPLGKMPATERSHLP